MLPSCANCARQAAINSYINRETSTIWRTVCLPVRFDHNSWAPHVAKGESRNVVSELLCRIPEIDLYGVPGVAAFSVSLPTVAQRLRSLQRFVRRNIIGHGKVR